MSNSREEYQVVKVTEMDKCYGTVQGAVHNALQREWQIQKQRVKELEAQLESRARASYLPQLVACKEELATARECAAKLRERTNALILAASKLRLRVIHHGPQIVQFQEWAELTEAMRAAESRTENPSPKINPETPPK